MLLYIIIALLAVAVAILAYLWRREAKREHKQYKNSMHWYGLFMEAKENMEASEIGRDEETEAYEQMYLSHTERIQSLIHQRDMLSQDRQLLFAMAIWHEMHCLPDLELIRLDGLVDPVHWAELKREMGVMTG